MVRVHPAPLMSAWPSGKGNGLQNRFTVGSNPTADFMAMSANEFLANYETIKSSMRGTQCCDCHVRLDRDITGMQWTSEGYMCDDCYFSSLGEIVEQYPICDPTKAR